jgi:hypothetical protein
MEEFLVSSFWFLVSRFVLATQMLPIAKPETRNEEPGTKLSPFAIAASTTSYFYD